MWFFHSDHAFDRTYNGHTYNLTPVDSDLQSGEREHVPLKGATREKGAILTPFIYNNTALSTPPLRHEWGTEV
jgi:hypothetical protein